MQMTSRQKKIADAVKEMTDLIVEKRRVRNAMRNMASRVKEDLGMNPSDFTMAMRLHSMALQNRESTLNTVREILVALGASIPMAIAPQKKLPLTERQSQIIGLLAENGPLTAAKIREALPKIGQVGISVNLSRLKSTGDVHHDIDRALWMIPNDPDRSLL